MNRVIIDVFPTIKQTSQMSVTETVLIVQLSKDYSESNF